MSDESDRWLKVRAKRWARVVPLRIAYAQATWERLTFMERGLAAGIHPTVIGARLGLTSMSVSYAVSKAKKFTHSPIDRYFREQGDIAKLAGPRRRCSHCGSLVKQ